MSTLKLVTSIVGCDNVNFSVTANTGLSSPVPGLGMLPGFKQCAATWPLIRHLLQPPLAMVVAAGVLPQLKAILLNLHLCEGQICKYIFQKKSFYSQSPYKLFDIF